MYDVFEIVSQALLLGLLYIFSLEKDGTIIDLTIFSLMYVVSYFLAVSLKINYEIVIGAFMSKIIVNFMENI